MITLPSYQKLFYHCALQHTLSEVKLWLNYWLALSRMWIQSRMSELLFVTNKACEVYPSSAGCVKFKSHPVFLQNQWDSCLKKLKFPTKLLEPTTSLQGRLTRWYNLSPNQNVGLGSDNVQKVSEMIWR